jgi:hypothetical protein
MHIRIDSTWQVLPDYIQPNIKLKANMHKQLEAVGKQDQKAQCQHQQEEGIDMQQELLTEENTSVDMQKHLKVSLEFIECLQIIFAGRTLC